MATGTIEVQNIESITITPSGAGYSQGQIELRKVGNIVFCNSVNNMVFNIPSANAKHVIANIPQGFRPSAILNLSVDGMVGTTILSTFILKFIGTTTDSAHNVGDIELYCNSTGARECNFSTTWFTAE